MSKKINTGGPALPIPLTPGEIRKKMGPADGMTLRDHFAAKALQGYLASFDPHGEPVEFATKIAEDAYAMADAMLRARQEGGAA